MAAILTMLWILAGSAAPTAQLVPPLQVYVSILPQTFFAERIGADRIEVHVMVGPGQSPGTYEPTPRQMTELQQADLYFSVGVPFEQALLANLEELNPDLQVINTAAGCATRIADGHHGNEPDPHTWLSPRLAMRQAQVIADALSRQDPQNSAHYQRQLEVLLGDLAALDQRVATLLAPMSGRAFFVFHPAFGYFAEAYGLRQVAVETGGHEPGARHLAALIDEARRLGARTIFAQPQFSSKSAAAVARALGGEVVFLDPLASDYLANIERIARTLGRTDLGRADLGRTGQDSTAAEPGHALGSPGEEP